MSVRTAAQTALIAGVITVALASAAWASAARTFVSGSGSDSNSGANCPQGTPCRSFAVAYSVTSSGGEIIALDSAGYGELTITGPVSIIGALIASVQVAANTTGITINAGPSDNIILRNLQINGGNAVNSVGISVGNNAGHLTLQNSTLKLLSVGLNDTSAKVDLQNCDIIGNGTGIVANGNAVDPNNFTAANTGLTEVRISGGNITSNVTGFTINNPGSSVNNANQNRIPIWVNSFSEPNIVGNSTFFTATGTGTSACNPQNCTPFATYTTNPSSQFQ